MGGLAGTPVGPRSRLRPAGTRADAGESVPREGRRDLEELREAGQTVKLHVLGLATIGNDVSPELALATISSVEVLGAFRASRAVKEALATRTTG